MKFFLNENNVMVDLETLSLKSNAFIVSIGAVRFYNTITDTFYRTIKVKNEDPKGFDLDMDTIVWWMKQSDEARKVFDEVKAVSLHKALTDLTVWMGEDATLWGNGAAFDNVVLTNAYKQKYLDTPWKYNKNLCFRTMRSLFPDYDTDWQGTHHNALDDAMWQAKTLINIFKAIAKN